MFMEVVFIADERLDDRVLDRQSTLVGFSSGHEFNGTVAKSLYRDPSRQFPHPRGVVVLRQEQIQQPLFPPIAVVGINDLLPGKKGTAAGTATGHGKPHNDAHTQGAEPSQMDARARSLGDATATY